MEGAPLCLPLRSLALPERPVIFSTSFSFIILSGVAARDGGSVLGALLDIRAGDNDQGLMVRCHLSFRYH